MRKSVNLIGSVIVLALILGVSVGGLGSQTLAQFSDGSWGEPINLSRSGAASAPVVVTGPEGTLQAFWWDQFDRVMTATFEGEEWSSPTQAPIVMTTEVGQGDNTRTVSTPVEEMPAIGGGNGYAHALWRGEPDDETDLIPLVHSRLALGTNDWSRPRAIAEAALAWGMTTGPDETVHLVYIRTHDSDRLPAGVYHIRSTDNGSRWSAPQALYESAYVRLLDPQEIHLWVATGLEGEVYAAWDDPRLERAFLARSMDGGESWGEAQTIGDPDDSPRRARVILTQGDPLLLWEVGTGTGCTLYQQWLVTETEATVNDLLTSTETLTTNWRMAGPALEDLGSCPHVLTSHRREDDHPVLVMGGGTGTLTVVAWNGAQWSQPKRVSFSFEHPQLERQVYLDTLDTALWNGHLGIVGLGQDGDVWYLASEMEAWNWAFAPLSPWSEPLDVSQSDGVPGRPAVAVDAEGQVHLLWSESLQDGLPGSELYYARRSDNRWSRPAMVLDSPEGRTEDPTLVAAGDRLHAVWSSGWSGAITHSQAYVRDAYVPGGWSEPEALPTTGATGGSPDMLIDAHGTLHVVYAVPLNEGRGITYVRSDDGGESWSEARVIFDASAEGWAMADHPTLAMDPAGTLYVAWVRGSSEGPFPPEAIFYARSTDGGQRWSEARAMAEGAYDWSRMAVPIPGQVHLLWNDVTDGGGWTHRWSFDQGDSWSTQQQVPGFRDVAGPVGLTADGVGTLYLVGLGRDEAGKPALVYTTWSAEDDSLSSGTGGRWGEQETVRLQLVDDILPGAAVAMAGAQGELSVAFRAEMEDELGSRHRVFHASRSVPTVETEPVPSYTPMPTMTPTPGPTPTPTPTPRPAVPVDTPKASPPVLDLGPITLPMTALGGLAVATLIVAGVLVGRGVWIRRR